jgi:hypothetical protein
MRWVVAGLAVLVLLALLGWQFYRDRLIDACREQGGRWDGAASSCRSPDGPIIIRPDLQRI